MGAWDFNGLKDSVYGAAGTLPDSSAISDGMLTTKAKAGVLFESAPMNLDSDGGSFELWVQLSAVAGSGTSGTLDQSLLSVFSSDNSVHSSLGTIRTLLCPSALTCMQCMQV